MSEKLKPCPFCGSDAVVSKAVMFSRPFKKGKSKGPFYYIGCSDPDCILYNNGRRARLIFRTRNNGYMERRWNRRVE